MLDITAFLSADGQKTIVEFIERAKTERGKGWLDELKKEYPFFNWIAELVSKPEAEALAEIKTAYPLLKTGLFDAQLLELHRKIKFEIERRN